MTASPLPAGTDVGDSPGGKFQSRTGIYDAAGNEIGALLASRLAALVAGLTANQPISAASLPLPAGAATDAKVEAVRALLASTLAISAAALPLPAGAATETKLEAVRALLAGTLAISAASLPLPTGAATSAKQDAAAIFVAAIQAATEAAQPARQSFTITPNDTTAITPLPRAVRVNTAGTVAYRAVDSAADVTVTVSAGETIPARIQYIRATGTSATGFVGHA